ncbi:MAG: hypothetical protein WCT77_14780, partial [Bacteroidota bacterium]
QSQSQETKDAFESMLNTLGISTDNLGYTPKGYWMRYPVPQDIPYKFVAFDGLFEKPDKIYDYCRNMALSVEDFLHPDYMKNNHNGIMKVGYYCGVQNLTSQFRAYNSSLWAEIDSTEPLLKAIKEIYTVTHSVWRYNRMEEAADFPLVEKSIRTAITKINPDIQKLIARTVLHLLEAWQFRQIGMRNVNMSDAEACWRIRHLGETQFDGMEYFPQMENVAKTIDMNSIYYAGLKVMETGQLLGDTIVSLKHSSASIDWKNQNLNILTPIGRIILSGSRDDVHIYNDAFLLVDFGGNDLYKGCAGATPSLNIPISLVVDISGDDKYVNEDEYMPSQGAAIFGAAMLLDMDGDDEYISKRLSQGTAMFGIGILADMEGNDRYDLWTDGQGAAYFGIGLTIDNKGDDYYTIWGDGQGYGGVGGVGMLINRTGNDTYLAEKESNRVFRPDYHSKNGEHNYTYCQGSGVGRRGDVTDGHSWAGGLGGLIDIDGNDVYESGNWSQGCGYWYGMGFLYDRTGDDKYISTTWSQACGAHFCIGVLFDEAGNDEYSIWEEQGVGMGFGHDYTIAILFDRKGNDNYKLKDNGLGYAINKSQVFFIDGEGDDTYIRGGKGFNYGWNNFTENNPPTVEYIYHLYSDQICIFADLKGKDSYTILNYDTKEESLDSLMKDGAELLFPNKEDRAKIKSQRYYGMGKDFDNFTGPEIEIFRDKMKKKFPEFK